RHPLVEGRLRSRQVEQVRRAGVRGPHEREEPRAGVVGGGDQRVERVGPQHRVDGRGVGRQRLDAPPGALGAREERLRVGGGADGDVAALSVRDHQKPGPPRRLDDGGERGPARRPQALEAGELRLDGDARWAGELDQPPAVGGHRPRRALGRLTRAAAELWIDRGRVGIEAQADARAALGYERRQPIGEGLGPAGAQPLTRDLSAAPAENRGTRPPWIVIRSPVRGFTPWRAARSATLNLPKPVKFTSPPPARTSAMLSSTASTASAAAFLLPMRASPARRSTNSALVTRPVLLDLVGGRGQSNSGGRRQ